MGKMPSKVYHHETDNPEPMVVRKPVVKTRPVHAAAISGQILNKDPKKKYVVVSKKEDEDLNYVYYQSIGFDFVRKQEKGGESVYQGTPVKVGEPLEWRGMVVMYCSLERAKEIFLKGPSGSSGQEYQDRLMQKIKQGQLSKRIAVGGMHQMEYSDAEEIETFR